MFEEEETFNDDEEFEGEVISDIDFDTDCNCVSCKEQIRKLEVQLESSEYEIGELQIQLCSMEQMQNYHLKRQLLVESCF